MDIYLIKKRFFRKNMKNLDTYLKKIKKVYKEQGIEEVLKRIFYKIILYYPIRLIYRDIKSYTIFKYLNIFKPISQPLLFSFRGKQYQFFRHWYNSTWENERAVEVPIVWAKTWEYKNKRILEVGDVLRHYFNLNHDILDKYERGKKIIKKDVVNFKPTEKYDLIVSISTLEHVGWDEEVKTPGKNLMALDNLRNNCLARGGEIMVTFPLGHNLDLDQLFFTNKLSFSETFFLKRISADNFWKEATKEDCIGAKYNYPFPWANVVVIGILKN